MRQKSSTLWSALTHGSAYVYNHIIQSPLGRGLSSYRTPRVAETLQKPISPARLFFADLLRDGRLMRGISGAYAGLTRIKVSLYGLTGLLYGIFGALLYVLLHYIIPHGAEKIEYPLSYLMIFSVFVILSIPLLFSRRRAGQALLTGRLTGWLFVDLLGVPDEGISYRREARTGLGWGILPAMFLAIAGVALTIYLHPLVLPVCFVALCLIGLVFALPETGAVLTVFTLPLLWVRDDLLAVTLGLICVTWLSLFFKWLQMHRTMHWGPLDMVMALCCGSLLLGGVTGAYVNAESIISGITYALLLSVYFLVAHLIKTKKAFFGCLFGLGLAFALILPSLYGASLYDHMVTDDLAWMAGSVGGNTIATLFSTLLSALGGWWQTFGICLLLMMLPFLFGQLLLSRRLLYGIVLTFCMLLSCYGLILAGSWGGLWVAVLVGIVFCLLYRHELAAAFVVLLPVVASGGGLLLYFFGIHVYDSLVAYIVAQNDKVILWEGIWRMLCDHPAGIGMSRWGFAELFPRYVSADALQNPSSHVSFMGQVAVGLGIPGLILLGLLTFFFVQKALTCLRRSGSRRDRVWILSGLMACLAMTLYSIFSSNPMYTPVFLAWVVVAGLSNEYQNMVFLDCDALCVVNTPTDHTAERVYRV